MKLKNNKKDDRLANVKGIYFWRQFWQSELPQSICIEILGQKHLMQVMNAVSNALLSMQVSW